MFVGQFGVGFAGNIVGAPPPSEAALAWVSQAQWVLVVWGYWLDRHRTPKGPGTAGGER